MACILFDKNQIFIARTIHALSLWSANVVFPGLERVRKHQTANTFVLTFDLCDDPRAPSTSTDEYYRGRQRNLPTSTSIPRWRRKNPREIIVEPNRRSHARSPPESRLRPPSFDRRRLVWLRDGRTTGRPELARDRDHPHRQGGAAGQRDRVQGGENRAGPGRVRVHTVRQQPGDDHCHQPEQEDHQRAGRTGGLVPSGLRLSDRAAAAAVGRYGGTPRFCKFAADPIWAALLPFYCTAPRTHFRKQINPLRVRM